MADNTFTIKIITPNRVFYTGEATMVEFNTTEGEIGIYRNHIPLTVIVKPGVLRITGEDNREAALHAGFAEILPDSVRYKNAGQNKNFAKGYPFVGYTVTNKQPLSV